MVRHVKALRRGIEGCIDEVDFETLHASDAMPKQNKEAVRKWDTKRKHYEQNREKASQQEPPKPKGTCVTQKPTKKPPV